MNDTYEQNPDNPTLRRRPSRFSLVLVEGEGFEPSKAEPSDLQSDPFDRSGTPPNETEHYGDFPYLCQTVGAVFCVAPTAGAAGVRIRYHGARNPHSVSPSIQCPLLPPRCVAPSTP